METPRPTREEIAELQKHVGYGSAWLGPVLTGGQGSRVTDIEGRSYIDCTAQAWWPSICRIGNSCAKAGCSKCSPLPLL